MQIDFDEETHVYTVNGKKVPSVSEILAPLSAERYAEINPATLRQAALKGTAVHEATEIIDYGGEPEIEPETMGYINAYVDFLRDYFPTWEMIERIVPAYRFLPEGYPDEDNVMFCGTVDRYGTIDKKKCVVDIKTYASMTTDSLISASCQTAMYRAALWEQEQEADIKRYVLHLKKDGNYRLIDLDKFDRERGFNSPGVAWRLYEVWDAKERARKTNRKGAKKDGE